MITTWKDSLKGKKVKFIKNTSGSGLAIGETYYILDKTCNSNNNVTVSKTLNGPQCGGWCSLKELQLLTMSKEDLKGVIETYENSIKDMQEKVKDVKSKIEFMETQKLDEFDEDTFKAWKIMQIMGIENIVQAKEIASVFKK